MSINKELVNDLRKAQAEAGRQICLNTELEAQVAELKGIMSETLCNIEYYPASLGEMWLVQDKDIEAMQAVTLEGK